PRLAQHADEFFERSIGMPNGQKCRHYLSHATRKASAVAVFASVGRVREGGLPIIVVGQNTWVCTGHAVIAAAGMLLLRLTLRVGLRIASIPISQVGFIVFAAFMSRFGQAYAQRRLFVFRNLLGKVV